MSQIREVGSAFAMDGVPLSLEQLLKKNMSELDENSESGNAVRDIWQMCILRNGDQKISSLSGMWPTLEMGGIAESEIVLSFVRRRSTCAYAVPSLKVYNLEENKVLIEK